jgi:hypothetical protein
MRVNGDVVLQNGCPKGDFFRHVLKTGEYIVVCRDGASEQVAAPAK